MDDIDSLVKNEIAEEALINAARKPLVIHNPRKVCWFCGSPTDDVRRWCDAQCRDVWQLKNPNYR